MAELLERRKSLHRRVEDFEIQCSEFQEQMDSLQPLANLGLNWAMCAHEMNNLLMPICNWARLALENSKDEALREKSLQKILKMSEQASLIMEKVMTIAAPGGDQKARHNLSKLLDDVFICIGRDFSKDKIHVVRMCEQSINVFAEKTSIQQVLLNLILNARQAMLDKGGVLKVNCRQNDEDVSIEISDSGCGMEAQQLKDIFKPFFTRGKKNGKGLGLAFCRKVVESHGGCISVESQVGQGTSFKILLPNEKL